MGRKQYDEDEPHRGSKKLICPMHQKTMYRVCHKCPWWMDIVGTNKNTGEQFKDHYCAMFIMPHLTIEANRLIDGLGSATEGVRNQLQKSRDVVKQQYTLLDMKRRGVDAKEIQGFDRGTKRIGTSTSTKILLEESREDD